MILNHLNLGVTEIEKTVALFETHFGLTRAPGTPLNQRMAFLMDDAGALLALFKVEDAVYPKIFHIGFLQKSAADVARIHAKLLAAGFAPGPAHEDHGRFTFYFQAPGGFTIEVEALHTRSPQTAAT
jgi:catechol 2,3-dioxygenase-like lactoylglutathione lyase family enzyme